MNENIEAAGYISVEEYKRTHKTTWGWCNFPPDPDQDPQISFLVSWNKPREWYKPYFQVTIWRRGWQFGFLF